MKPWDLWMFYYFDNYIAMFDNAKYLGYFKNSLITSAGSVAISLVVSVLAAYGFSRFHFRCKNLLMTSLMNIQVFPVTVIIISLFTFYSKLGLQSTYQGLILADLVYSLPFTVWFLKAFIDTVPVSLDEAARIDGLNEFGIFRKIVFPLGKPAMATLTIFTFTNVWNDFMGPLIYLKTKELKTVQLGIRMFISQYGADYAWIMAASVCSLIPIVIVFLSCQRFFVEGVAASGIKG